MKDNWSPIFIDVGANTCAIQDVIVTEHTTIGTHGRDIDSMLAGVITATGFMRIVLSV